MTAIRDRDAAFEALFAQNYRSVRNFAVRRVPEALVEDVVAETFIVAWRRLDDISGEPRPWLFGVARRVIANQLRGQRRREALVGRLQATTVRLLDDEPGTRQERADIVAALARLSEREREALLLVAWEGLDAKAAAQVLGCSVATFRVRLHRARRRVARALQDEEMLAPALILPLEAS
jgi:RNA polymerase sigma-70 factor, ECF subfamily